MPSKPQGTKRLVAGIVGAVAVFTGVAFLALSPTSPFVTPGPPSGPAMMVGQHAYVYACGVFDADFIAKTLGINTDKNKQAAEESFALAPDNTKDKQIDLTKLTGYKAASSECRLKFDKQTKGEGEERFTTFVNVTLTLNQFGNEDDAKTYFEALKSQIGKNGKNLASHKNSVYGTPTKTTGDSSTFIRPNILHKNMVINISAPLAKEDTSGDQAAQKVDKVASDVITRINEHKSAGPKNFNGISKIANHPFVDTCHSVNYVTLTKAMGDHAELDPTFITSSQAFSPVESDGKTPPVLNSSCSLSYRTQAEVDSQKSMQSNQDEFSSKFPHYLILQAYVTENNEQAKKFLAASKESAKAQQAKDPKMQYSDIDLGDGGLKVVTSAESAPKEGETTAPKATYEAQIYYMVEGPYIYALTNSMTRQDTPYKTTDKKFTDDNARTALKALHKGRLFAERTAK